MRTATSILAASILGAAMAAFGAEAQTVELKDGGRIVVEKGKTYHVDAKGKRVRMKDGVVMEGKDGEKYIMKNDAVFKQIIAKGTSAPNR